MALHYAKQNEDYWEVAAIAKYKPTITRQIRKHFKESGYPTVHKYLNHYDLFKNSLPRVTGAFTDDLKFGDYLCGDDHKADVAQVYAYDELKKEVVLKQVNIWSWDEPVTMKTWVFAKVGALTVDDLIYSIMPVLNEFGLPAKGIITDNGIANSERWRTFCSRLYETCGIDGYKYSAPYEPTNKATTELKHAIWKKEFDAFQKNYVAPHKEKGRHRGDALSPEEADMFFEDYQQKFESYITGWYLDRVRRRTINGKTVNISIKDYFNDKWKNYEAVYPTPQQLRWALSLTTTAVYNNKIMLGKEQYLPVDDSCTVAFNGNRFTLLYNPRDLKEIDLYALSDFTDRTTGVTYSKGSYITTLINTRLNGHKREHVYKLQKEIKKSLKQLSVSVTAMNELKNSMPDKIAMDGEVIKERERFRKQTETLLEQKITELPERHQPLQVDKSEIQETSEYHLTQEN